MSLYPWLNCVSKYTPYISRNYCPVKIGIIILQHEDEQKKPCWSNSVTTSDLCPCGAIYSFTGHPASWPPHGPSVARGVERLACQQSLWYQEPLTRLDLCPVCEGPLGALHIQPPPTGPPAKALPHCSQLRLALRLHSDADAHAARRPKVSPLALLLFSIFCTSCCCFKYSHLISLPLCIWKSKIPLLKTAQIKIKIIYSVCMIHQ